MRRPRPHRRRRCRNSTAARQACPRLWHAGAGNRGADHKRGASTVSGSGPAPASAPGTAAAGHGPGCGARRWGRPAHSPASEPRRRAPPLLTWGPARAAGAHTPRSPRTEPQSCWHAPPPRGPRPDGRGLLASAACRYKPPSAQVMVFQRTFVPDGPPQP